MIVPFVPPIAKNHNLTARETEVFGWLGQAKTVADIATILGLSPKTVVAHVSNLMRKLCLYNRAEVVLAAIEYGFAPCPCAYHRRLAVAA